MVARCRPPVSHTVTCILVARSVIWPLNTLMEELLTIRHQCALAIFAAIPLIYVAIVR
ncbi:hypothetical protein BDF19DRAFT_431508 [Syncephalis fuscata]|nr:hypothetical protein BDF19DRAFT_431508 [Syncephalis fuscata]